RGDRHSQSDRGRSDHSDRQVDHGRSSGRDSRSDSSWSRDHSDSRPQRDGNWTRDRSDSGSRRDNNWTNRDNRSNSNWDHRSDGHADQGDVFRSRRPDTSDHSWNREPDHDWRRGDDHFDVGYRNVHFFHDRPFVEYIGSRTDWNDVAVFCGFVGLMGYLDHDDFLCFAGSAGALYALWRYDDDLACDDPYRHARACYFSMPFFYRDGVRFERHIVLRDGVRYYQFVRC
ncbi:MAG TPA: hypothetical protein VMI31_10250, partial [Fimbriimonadaceae bacterium]|nr:hypothetical protein [Fimbriimonadaceae bacterium]